MSNLVVFYDELSEVFATIPIIPSSLFGVCEILAISWAAFTGADNIFGRGAFLSTTTRTFEARRASRENVLRDVQISRESAKASYILT